MFQTPPREMTSLDRAVMMLRDQSFDITSAFALANMRPLGEYSFCWNFKYGILDPRNYIPPLEPARVVEASLLISNMSTQHIEMSNASGRRRKNIGIGRVSICITLCATIPRHCAILPTQHQRPILMLPPTRKPSSPAETVVKEGAPFRLPSAY